MKAQPLGKDGPQMKEWLILVETWLCRTHILAKPGQVVQVPDAREATNMLLARKLNDKCGSETVSTCFYLLGTLVVKAGGEAVRRDVWMSLAKRSSLVV